MTDQAKPIDVGPFMAEVGRLLRHMPNIGVVKMPFCHSTTVQQILSLRTPRILIFLKILSLAISLFIPFMLQQVYHNLHDSQYLFKLIFLVLGVGLMRIFVESYSGWLLSQMQLNFKRILGKVLVHQELMSKNRDHFDQLWVLINNDANMIGNYHSSFLSTYYEIARMLFAGVYLYFKMRSAVFVGLAVGIALAKMNFKVATKIGALYDELVVLRAKKIKIISFFTNRVQDLKMCRLEDYIYKKMLKIREEEFQNLTYNKFLDAFCVFAWQITSVLISSVSFTVYLLYFKMNTVDKNFNIMTIITFFQMLIMPLNMLPWGFGGMRNGRNSRDRIANQIKVIEKVRSDVVIHDKSQAEVKVQIKFGLVDAYADFQLKVHPMELKKGHVYAVKGPFGSGKSLFMKSLVHLLSSNYQCQIYGRVGYVQPTSYHLRNAFCSVYDTPDARDVTINKQLKNLMVSFHCLEIPLKNESETFSGGEKLRLGLVRATLGRDVIVVDTSLESLDDRVRKYIENELREIARREGKIFLVESEWALSGESIEIRDKEVRLVKSQEFKPQANLEEHEREKQVYCDSYLKPMNELFNTEQPKLILGPSHIDLKYFKLYYKSFLHILFLLSMIGLYSLKNYYNYYTVNFIKTDQHFIRNLGVMVVGYILVVMSRSLLFAKANLNEAKRLVQTIIKNLCYDKIDRYREKGAQEISLTYTDSCEALGNGYPFQSNILFNNIFEFLFTLGMILLQMPYAIVPSMLLLIYFKKTQLYFRKMTHGLEDMSKFANLHLLQTVQNIQKGKNIIIALKDEDKYIYQFDKWNERWTNCKACSSVLGLWLSQRFQLITLWLLLFILFIVYHYFDKFEMESKGLSIVITYCVDLADKLGHLVRSVADTEREGRNIRKYTQYNQPEEELDTDRMADDIKNQIKMNEKGPQELTLENVWFKYPGEKEDILKGLNLNIKSQQKIMIRGKTGAGKTTLFKILTKVYLPKEKLNRGYIAFSPQKPLILIDASLEQNLDPYGLIAKDVLQKYIDRFSTTDVEKLTTSQQLRVNMYRAELYGRNSVIVYDEPGLDVCKNSTCIIVSHHGDYKVDRKYELKQGVLVPTQ